MIEIFNVQLFGSDADFFLNLSKEDKRLWILSNTNQKSEILIHDFLCTCKKSGKKCTDCGKNISSGIPKEVANSSKPIKNSIGNKSDNNVGRKPTEKRKG